MLSVPGVSPDKILHEHNIEQHIRLKKRTDLAKSSDVGILRGIVLDIEQFVRLAVTRILLSVTSSAHAKG